MEGPIESWLAMPQNRLKDVTVELLLSEAICKPLSGRHGVIRRLWETC